MTWYAAVNFFLKKEREKYIFEPRHWWHLLTSGAVQVSALESDSQ